MSTYVKYVTSLLRQTVVGYNVLLSSLSSRGVFPILKSRIFIPNPYLLAVKPNACFTYTWLVQIAYVDACERRGGSKLGITTFG